MFIRMQLDKEILNAINTYGPQVTLSEVTVQNVSFSIFSGKGVVKELKIGSPRGFRSSYAIKIPKIVIDIKLSSVFSDCILIESIKIDRPEIIFEHGVPENNLVVLMNNLKNYSSTLSSKKLSKRLVRVGNIDISTGVVHIYSPEEGLSPDSIPLRSLSLNELNNGNKGQIPGMIGLQIADLLLQHILRSIPSLMS